MAAVAYVVFYENGRYVKAVKRNGGFAPPEQRLPGTIVGGVCIPIGLFWFAWTNYPSIHWIVSIIATVPFGFGMVSKLPINPPTYTHQTTRSWYS